MTTFAGTGRAASDDGDATRAASFNRPFGVAVARDGTVYVSERFGQRVRRVRPDGHVETVAGAADAGFADGDALGAARFSDPRGIALSPDETRLYVRDAGRGGGVGGVGNRKLSPPPPRARAHPCALLFSRYVCDAGNNAVRCVDLASARVATVAGGEEGFRDGHLADARFSSPCGCAVAADGSVCVADRPRRRVGIFLRTRVPPIRLPPIVFLLPFYFRRYVADWSNHAVRRIFAESVTTFAGSGENAVADGVGRGAALASPVGLFLDEAEGLLYVSTGHWSHRVRTVTLPDRDAAARDDGARAAAALTYESQEAHA